MKASLCVVFGLTALLGARAAAQDAGPARPAVRTASFQGLGDLPGGAFESMGLRVSADGAVVVGNSASAAGRQAFRWTQRDGMVSLANLPDGSFRQSWAVGVSGNGDVIVGYGDPDGGGKWETHRGYRWTQGNGMALLGGLAGAARSEALAISTDGSVIVGDNGTQAFRWAQRDGIVALGVLPNRSNSRAIAVSADGSVVTGSSYQLPAWDHEEAFVWTPAGGMQGLGIPPGSSASFPNAISADGSVIVGSLTGAGVFRWNRSTGMTTLGQFPGARVTHPSAVTADGAIIVGTSSADRRAPSIAFIWDAAHGMRSLQTVLETEHGLNLAGWHLQNASGLTPDGAVIVGWGTNPAGQTEAFRATLKSIARETLSLSGDYLGQPPPGATPEVFARGIVSTDDLEHSSPYFSPDGNEVFWRASRRPGPANREWLVFNLTMRRENGRWSAPRPGPFESQLVFSVDGRRAYFNSAPPNSAPASAGQPIVDVWCSERQGDGWSEPRCLNLVARYPELRSARLATTARNGTLYLEAYTPGPLNDSGIYRCAFINGEYAKPELLPRSINLPPFLNWTPFIAPDESFLLFSSNRRDPAHDAGDLYLSRRLADGSWTEPVSLGERVNSNRQERFPLLSPDGKYLFFTRPTPGHDQDVYWVDTATIPALRPTTNPSQEIPK